ncbi:MAG: hypothetical protein IKA85_05220 [Clostridia bacterium]|nr:hypothetical protein [Clostridia bacterium]
MEIVNNKSDSTNSILNTEEKVNNNSKNSLDTNKYSKKPITLTDGQVKKKLANYTNLKVYSHTANNVKHNKFNLFRCYEIRVSFNNEEYGIILNVGHSKFEDKYHIYDITKKEELPTSHLLVWRAPKITR